MSASETRREQFVRDLLLADPWRMAVLRTVRGLDAPDCWVGAGFVRNMVWDALHDYDRPTPLADIDVLYFDPADLTWAAEERYEAALRRAWSEPPWSVRNQARMHLRNDDPPYRDTRDALTYWLETATAVAVRLDGDDSLYLAAPLGLDDLVNLCLRPAPAGRRRAVEYRNRVAAKAWAEAWPKLKIEMPSESEGRTCIDAEPGNR